MYIWLSILRAYVFRYNQCTINPLYYISKIVFYCTVCASLNCIDVNIVGYRHVYNLLNIVGIVFYLHSNTSTCIPYQIKVLILLSHEQKSYDLNTTITSWFRYIYCITHVFLILRWSLQITTIVTSRRQTQSVHVPVICHACKIKNLSHLVFFKTNLKPFPKEYFIKWCILE